MVVKKLQQESIQEINSMGGKGALGLEMLYSNEIKPSNVKVFAKATLMPGDSIGYHVHTGESETYYILSGEGYYNDNGNFLNVNEGDVTVTCNGQGHSLENSGDTPLEFMVLIVFD